MTFPSPSCKTLSSNLQVTPSSSSMTCSDPELYYGGQPLPVSHPTVRGDVEVSPPPEDDHSKDEASSCPGLPARCHPEDRAVQVCSRCRRSEGSSEEGGRSRHSHI